VVLVHYFAAFYPYAVFGNQGSYQQQALWENIFFYPPFGLLIAGHFAICIFFILSGYVLSYNYLGEVLRIKKIIAAIIKRPIRLGGLVLFTIIIGSCLWFGKLYFNTAVSDISMSKPWFISFWKGSFELHQLILDIMTSMFSAGVTYNPPLWTIKIELYGSMLVFLFVLIFGRFKYRLVILFIALALFRKSLYFGFFLGIIIADLVRNYNFISRLESKHIFIVVLLTMFVYFSSYPKYANYDFIKLTIYEILPNDSEFAGGYSMLSALLLFIIVTINRQIKNFLNYPLFQFLGRISYGIYSIHFLVIGSISSWMFLNINSHLGYGLSFIVVLLSGILIILFLAYWATIYIDNPAIKCASYIDKKLIAFMNFEALINIKNLITRRSS
jgi:peptidoglycan/LPS O-acetylase OafA/YrhL